MSNGVLRLLHLSRHVGLLFWVISGALQKYCVRHQTVSASPLVSLNTTLKTWQVKFSELCPSPRTYFLIRDLWFLRWRQWRFRSSGVYRRVLWHMGADVLVEPAVSIFGEEMFEPEGENCMFETLTRPNYRASSEHGNREPPKYSSNLTHTC
jgi:hypothetical protein